VENALAAVRRTFDYKLHTTISYPEAPVYRLQAELLEGVGKREEAAKAYEDAGNYYGWRNNFQTAVTLLEKARDLNPNSAQIYWDLSNAYYISSRSENYPFVKADVLVQSREAWEKGTSISLPDAENSWVYLCKSYIIDRLIVLTNNYHERLGLFWEAIAYVEHALLLHEADTFRWTFLAYAHRRLGNYSNALDAVQQALTQDEKNVGALDEYSIILANLGHFDEAMATIEKRLNLEANVAAEAVKSYILIHMGEKEKALDTIEKVLQSSPTEVWFRALHAFCNRILDHQSAAMEDYKVIWESYKENDLNNLFDSAWAAFYLGKVDQAIKMMQQALLDPLQDNSSAHVSLARFYFEKGDLPAAEKHLNLFTDHLSNLRQLNDFLEFDYPEIQKAYAGRADDPQIMAMLNQAVEKMEEKREELAQGKSPLEELQQRIAQYRDNAGNDDRVIVGMTAGLARLRCKQKDWNEAVTNYQFLQRYPTLFPEAKRGLAAIFKTLQNEGDALLKPPASQAPDPAGALACYSKLLSFEPFTEDKIQQSGLYVRMGLASLAIGDRTNMHQSFLNAFRVAREGTIPEPGEHLGLICSSLLTQVHLYWALEDEWRALANMPDTNEQIRLDINTARNTLQAFLHREYQLSSDTVSPSPIERLMLEIGEGLVPEDTSNNMPLVKDHIPAIRQQLYAHWGIVIPPIRVRDNARLADNEYLIMLDEIPFARTTVPLSMGFCLTPAEQLLQLGIPADDVKEATHPLDGSPCCWVAPDSWSIVTEHHIELWTDLLFFITVHMKALLLQHLAEFVRLQDIDALLEIWKASDLGIALIHAALPDNSTHLYLSMLLRALLKEQVPITAWEDILTGFCEASKSGSDFRDMLRTIRLRLQRFLPGNASDKTMVQLPAELEAKIIAWTNYQQNTWILTATPQEVWELLTAISSLVQPYNADCVLVVSHPELRWLVRQMLEMAFPALMVLSSEEILSSSKQ
jgi:tetratricopeptide (TPR) repeat protein